MLPLTLAEAIDAYARETGKQRAAAVRRYFDYAGSLESAREDRTFARWLRALADSGLKPATVDQYARTVRAWFRRFAMAPPKAKVAFDPRIHSDHKVLDHDTALALLAALPRLRPFAAGTLALAATYGLRAVELARIDAQAIDIEGRRVFIQTAKGGTPRWCWLPPRVAAWLPEEWPRRTANGMQPVWRSMWAEALGTEPPAHVGWHSMRYAVIHGLRGAGVSPEAVVRFLRWRVRQEGEGLKTLAGYEGANQVVTAGGVEAMRTEDMGRREADAEAWEAHPFLAAIPAR